MQVKPKKNYRTPNYPTLTEANGDPSILVNRSVLLQGKKIALTASVLAMLSLSTGCVKSATEPGVSSNTSSTVSEPPISSEIPKVDSPRLDGDVQYMSALSEADILALICNQADKSKIQFAESPYIAKYGDLTVQMDLYDSAKNIGFAVLDKSEARVMTKADIEKNLTYGSVVTLQEDNADKVVTYIVNYNNILQDEKDVNKAIQEFLDWLKAEGML